MPAEAAYTRAGKVNKYCLLLREACTRLDEQRYLHSILTTCVKHQPPLLEEALRYVLNLRKDAGALPASTVTGNAGADAARSALKYLLLLVDVQQLYRAALASYDLKLALIVAQVCQTTGVGEKTLKWGDENKFDELGHASPPAMISAHTPSSRRCDGSN